MRIDTICSAADGDHNEDLIAVFEHGGVTDILVIDGGSAIAERNYIDNEQGDVVWFVRNFSLHLQAQLHPDRSQEESIVLALGALHRQFLEKCAGVAVPQYALPIAALSWLRLAGTKLSLYCLGDCKTLLCQPDGSIVDLDPYVNPQEQILQTAIRKLSEEGVLDAQARRERLMPMLRARREFLNTSVAPTILCLAPRGPLAARTFELALEPGATLLAMTDGLYRLVDTYHLLSVDELARRCLHLGLAAVLAELRDFEAASLGADSLSVKRADDASAVLCALA